MSKGGSPEAGDCPIGFCGPLGCSLRGHDSRSSCGQGGSWLAPGAVRTGVSLGDGPRSVLQGVLVQRWTLTQGSVFRLEHHDDRDLRADKALSTPCLVCPPCLPCRRGLVQGSDARAGLPPLCATYRRRLITCISHPHRVP